MSEKKARPIPPTVEACYTALDRAIKTLKLYMGKGELSVNAVEALYTTLTAHFEEADDLILEVRSEGLNYKGRAFDTGGRTVHSYFHLFKDGLRELSFLPGLTLDEVKAFMNIVVAQEDDAPAVVQEPDEDSWEGEQRDEDTVTRLWEADFLHIRYHAIDAYAEGEIFDPERGFTRSLADQIQERLDLFRPSSGKVALDTNSLSKATQPESLASRGALQIIESEFPPEEHMRGWRSRVSEDEALGMDRFAVIWGRLVQGAQPGETETLADLMVQMFRDWMDEGNWDALIRALKVMLSLRKRDENSQPIVSYVLDEIVSPPELLRLLPAVEAIQPEDAIKAVIFHKALGNRAVDLLCQMLRDVNIGRTVAAFEKAFSQQKVGVENIHLARLKSRDEKILVLAIERLGNYRAKTHVAEAIRPMLSRTEASVRYAALRALQGDDDPAVLKALKRALEAFDKGMRQYAITELVATGTDFARTALLDRVEAKEFNGLEIAERRNLLVAIATLAGEDIEDWFYEQLEKSSWFRKKELEAQQDLIREALKTAGGAVALGILEDMS